MGLFRRLFVRNRKLAIPPEYASPVDPFYASIKIEDVGLYQRCFEKIVEHVDLANYTLWSKIKEYDRAKLDADEAWMFARLEEFQREEVNGALLQNMVTQFFFADVLERKLARSCWIRRVMHPRKDVDFFPRGSRMRFVMELVDST